MQKLVHVGFVHRTCKSNKILDQWGWKTKCACAMLQVYAGNGHNSSTPRIMTGYYTFRYCYTLITYIKSFPDRTRILSNFARLKKIKVVHVLFFCTYTRTATDVQVPRVTPVKRIKMHFSSFTHYLPRLQCNKFIGTHVHFILDNNRTP